MGEGEQVCIGPDGEVCGHAEDRHGLSHPLFGAPYCSPCMVAATKDGRMPLTGPYIHGYNPCVWTAAGWLPLNALKGR